MASEPLEKTALSDRDTLARARHELRTPLNQILGYSEMLIEDAEQSGQESFIPDLKKIHGAAKQLVGLIQEYMGPGKPSAGRHEVAVAPASAPTATPAQGARETPGAFRGQPATGRGSNLLVVDDNETNRQMLGQRLEREGYRVSTAPDGCQALQMVSQQPFDLVLLDIMMPGMDGYGVLERMKGDPRLRHIPVIMISALDELESVVRCIELGAEDYLPKPFEPTLLRARIGACLEKKSLRDQEQRTYLALVESQRLLAAELAEAADYVKSLLPPPLAGDLGADWRFIPSTQLGGDAFGYHWLDPNHFAIYLLDVCGHGVGAALLSISVMNVLRAQSLPSTDFLDPGAVLGALNARFPMEDQNNMYFTMWYGVYHKVKRELAYASGGHPPAVLIPPGASGSQVAVQLRTQGPIIGALPDTAYSMARHQIPPGSTLYLFSDGTYEIARKDGTMWSLEQFVDRLAASPPAPIPALDDIVSQAQAVGGQAQFVDDFSIVRIAF